MVLKLLVRAIPLRVSNSVRVSVLGRRIHWVAIPFPGSAHVAAGPLNPPTLGARQVGAFTGAGIGCTLEKKLYGGWGPGRVGDPKMAAEVFQMGGFIVGK